jgi:Protein of unknown function (DUF3145)
VNDPLCWPGAGRVPGVLTILSCPPPLCPHVEFAVAAALGVPAPLDWSAQPARPTMAFAALEWRANAGAAGQLASRLRQLGGLTFEVVEGPAEGCDAERYAYTPELGLFHGAIGANGDTVVGEGQLRALLAETVGRGQLAAGVHKLIGTDWDEALEPLRQGGDGAPVTWLRQTG